MCRTSRRSSEPPVGFTKLVRSLRQLRALASYVELKPWADDTPFTTKLTVLLAEFELFLGSVELTSQQLELLEC